MIQKVVHLLPGVGQLVQHGNPPLTSSNTGTVSLAEMGALNISLLVTHGQWPEASSTALRFDPVVVLMSLETKLANIATSLHNHLCSCGIFLEKDF